MGVKSVALVSEDSVESSKFISNVKDGSECGDEDPDELRLPLDEGLRGIDDAR